MGSIFISFLPFLDAKRVIFIAAIVTVKDIVAIQLIQLIFNYFHSD
jgi:hypothetical protein